jgi:histidine triad (HIT) family protein
VTDCSFCGIAAGRFDALTEASDVVFRDERTTAFIGAKWWVNNPGHVIVIPNAHSRDLYEIDEANLGAVYATVKRVAIALKEAHGCNGISTRQHNEDAGNQDVWHFHVHVFPRWRRDELYEHHDDVRWTTPEERAPYAEKLKRCLTPEVSDTR